MDSGGGGGGGADTASLGALALASGTDALAWADMVDPGATEAFTGALDAGASTLDKGAEQAANAPKPREPNANQAYNRIISPLPSTQAFSCAAHRIRHRKFAAKAPNPAYPL